MRSSGPTCSSPWPRARALASTSCARITPTRRRSSTTRAGRSARTCWPNRYIAGRELTCAVLGDRAAGGDRDRSRRVAALLQLRGQVCRRRLAPSAAGADFIECLRIGAEVNADGPQGAWAAEAFRGRTFATTIRRAARAQLVCLEVNTQPGMTGDLAGSGTGGARRPESGGARQLDGGGGELQQVGPEADDLEAGEPIANAPPGPEAGPRFCAAAAVPAPGPSHRAVARDARRTRPRPRCHAGAQRARRNSSGQTRNLGATRGRRPRSRLP